MLLVIGALIMADGIYSLIMVKEHNCWLDAGRGIRAGIGILIMLYWLGALSFAL